MLRSFCGRYEPGAASASSARLRESLASEGEARLVQAGALAVAHTGPEIKRLAPDAPFGLLDGTIYEVLGMSPPARSGPELEAWLAQAWRDQGEALLGRLRGDFALLLFDPAARAGLLVRDQLGGRGAVWSEQSGVVSFATECAPLLRALPQRPGPDPVALSHWLAVSGMPADRSLYAGVRRVQAGHAVRLRPEGSAAFRHWAPEWRRPQRGGLEEHAAALREALERAVARRISPEQPTAALVSGGLDSGSVAALGANAPAEHRLGSIYSAVFPDHASVDESELIDELSGSLGLRSTQARVHGGSILAGALPYLRCFELPPVSPNLFFWIPLQARAAADGVRTMLDGEGGDELYGYSISLLADRLRHGRVLSAAGLVGRMPGAREEGTSLKVRALYLRRYGLKDAAPYWLHDRARRRQDPMRYVPPYLRPETAAVFAESDDQHLWKRTPGPRWFAKLAQRVASGMGPALAYDHIRRRALLAGIEPSHPLIDVDVIELMLRVPPELSWERRHSRPILRESMRGMLPDAVRLRPSKSTFDEVFHESLAGPDLPAVRALLGRRDAETAAYVDRAEVERLLEGPPDDRGGRVWWALYIWRLVTTECWLTAQDDPNKVDRLLDSPLPEARIELDPAAPLTVPG